MGIEKHAQRSRNHGAFSAGMCCDKTLLKSCEINRLCAIVAFSRNASHIRTMDDQTIDHGITYTTAAHAAGAVVAATTMLVLVLASGVAAQTLTEPNPQPKVSPPPVVAKAPPPKRVKSCSADGAGFVQVAGTDACIKIGGFVTIDGGR